MPPYCINWVWIRDILEYIARSAGDVTPALRFVLEIEEQCEVLARIPGMVGRARPELRADIRSFVFKNHVILFRYSGDDFEVVNILEGHRDIDAFFGEGER